VRKTIAALVVIGLVWIGYIAWPLYDLMALVRAIDARDVSTVVRYVNFDRVRASLTQQIVSAFVQMSGVQPGLVTQQAVVVGISIADPLITKLVSPEALSELLAVGWPVAAVPEPPPSGTVGISTDTLGTALQIFAASHYGIGRFEVSAPIVLSPANRFRLTFHLLSWRWRLVGITVPENVRNLLANEVVKAVRERR
jgi:Protein of unknown function (DUF2939)